MNEEQIKVLFGQKIKRLRTNLNITQFTLGELVNVNQRQITLIESGKYFPSLKTLVKFTQIFSCELQDLFLFENLQRRETLENELINILKKTSSDNIRFLYTIAKELN